MESWKPVVSPGKPIKLVVWDLDRTLWDGVLLEDGAPAVFRHARAVILGLDRLGILQSIASRNDFATAVAYLERIGIREYFLAPQISWSPKSTCIRVLAEELNIALDSVLFIDDQEFELEEVRFVHPEVRTMRARQAETLLNEPAIRPAVVADDAHRRRIRYVEDQKRKVSEREFTGPPEVFLKSLGLELKVRKAAETDLDRAEELISRTNQLNSTGVSYSRAELREFLESSAHVLLVADLKDRFGEYGTISLALLETRRGVWTLKLILVSCRVLSRGIGANLLKWLAQRAEAAQVLLQVEFRDTGRNRPMKVALMMAGFTRRSDGGGTVQLHREDGVSLSLPSHLQVISAW